MLISVIIPFYKGNEYMKQLVTILNENYLYLSKTNNNVEVIFVNDSPTVSIKFDKVLPLFDYKIINNKHNLGIHGTRIQGLKKCNGDYVMFLDQDDLITEDCLYSQIITIKDYDFIVCNGYIKELDGSLNLIFKSLRHQQCCLNLQFHYGYTNPIISPGQVLLKKNIIPKEWTNYSFKNNGADDHYLWLLLLEEKRKGTINENCLYTHVATGNNTSLNIQGMAASNLELISLLQDKACKHNLDMLRRRVIYNASCNHNIITKLKFIDVALTKYKYSKLLK